MKTNESLNASERKIADDDWDALVERRLSADLDAFLADADEATFAFPGAQTFVPLGREIVVPSRWTKSGPTRRAFASASCTALAVAVVWGLVSFGVFENVFAPKPVPETAMHEFFAFGGVESFRAVDAAIKKSDQVAADSLRRIGEWKNDVGISEQLEQIGVAVDSQLDAASKTGVEGVVLKHDPLVRFVDEYYLSDFRGVGDSDENF